MFQATWPFLALRDPVSSATHFAGLLLGVYGTLMLCRLCRGEPFKQFVLGSFGLSTMLLYAASSLYHAVVLSDERVDFFRKLDQSAIYVLIAGTFTPALMLLLPRGKRRLVYFVGIWCAALSGIVCRWVFPNAPYSLTLGLYILMGWTGVFPCFDLIPRIGVRGALWILMGGLAYTLGSAIDFINFPTLWPFLIGPHEIFHVFVMLGTFCHFSFMVRYVVPAEMEAEEEVSACEAAEAIPEPSLDVVPGEAN